eukprot:g8250.t1
MCPFGDHFLKEIREGAFTGNFACTPRQQCSGTDYDVGMFNNQQYGKSEDRECALRRCSCDNGVGTTGDRCALHGSKDCDHCHAGHYHRGSSCHPHSAPCSDLEKETQVPTLTQDRVCVPKVCQCSNGNAARGGMCFAHGLEACSSCLSGYYLDVYHSHPKCVQHRAPCSDLERETQTPTPTQDRKCVPHACLCPNGTPGKGAACPSHGATTCTACNGGHYRHGLLCSAHRGACSDLERQTQAPSAMQNRVCVPHACQCPNGTPSKGDACPSHGATACAACNSGWSGNTCDVVAIDTDTCDVVTVSNSVNTVANAVYTRAGTRNGMPQYKTADGRGEIAVSWCGQSNVANCWVLGYDGHVGYYQSPGEGGSTLAPFKNWRNTNGFSAAFTASGSFPTLRCTPTAPIDTDTCDVITVSNSVNAVANTVYTQAGTLNGMPQYKTADGRGEIAVSWCGQSNVANCWVLAYDGHVGYYQSPGEGGSELAFFKNARNRYGFWATGSFPTLRCTPPIDTDTCSVITVSNSVNPVANTVYTQAGTLNGMPQYKTADGRGGIAVTWCGQSNVADCWALHYDGHVGYYQSPGEGGSALAPFKNARNKYGFSASGSFPIMRCTLSCGTHNSAPCDQNTLKCPGKLNYDASTGKCKECDVSGSGSCGPSNRWDRVECGSNENEASCKAKDCMWGGLDMSYQSGSRDPWCYHKFQDKCAVNGDARQDCGTSLSGNEGHQKWLCESAGCCWQPTHHAQGRPWCFKSK